MMVSSVRRSLQSRVVESRVLSFQLFPREPSNYSTRFSLDVHGTCEVRKNSKHGEIGEGWSFHEALANGSEEDEVYVHPLVKNSSTKLSKKSLEMGESDISLMTLEADDSRPGDGCRTWMQKKANRRRRDTTYPPPLTSISTSTGVRIESYREDGRLVLRAVQSGIL